MHAKIKYYIKKNNTLSQKGLASHMKLNASGISRMLNGTRKIIAHEIPLIEKYLGISLENTKTPLTVNEATRERLEKIAQLIPVYKFSSNKKTLVDWTDRHPAQLPPIESMATYVESQENEPRYFIDELIYLYANPNIIVGSEVFVVTKCEQSFIATINSIHQRHYEYSTYKGRTHRINKENICFMFCIVGRG